MSETNEQEKKALTTEKLMTKKQIDKMIRDNKKDPNSLARLVSSLRA